MYEIMARVFPILAGLPPGSERHLVAGITLNQLKGRQMVIYIVWMVGYRSRPFKVLYLPINMV